MGVPERLGGPEMQCFLQGREMENVLIVRNPTQAHECIKGSGKTARFPPSMCFDFSPPGPFYLVTRTIM